MKRRWWVFIVVSALFILGVAVLMRVTRSDDEWKPWSGPTVERDLDSIRADTLRVLVLEDPLVWEQGPKEGTGLAFEWAERFAKKAGLRMQVVVGDSGDSLLTWLWEGVGDIVIAPLPESRGMRGHFRYTEPLIALEPYIASLRPELRESEGPSLSSSNDSLRLSADSPFSSNGYHFNSKGLPKGHSTMSHSGEEDMLVDLLLGQGGPVIVSGVRAGHETKRLPSLQFEGPIGKELPWRFTVRRNSPQLLAALDEWVSDDEEARAQMLKGFTDRIAAPGPLRSRRMKVVDRDSISPFDRYFRSHADGLSFDWRLLAAMAWKESRFDSTVTSHKGAMGIMQIMPRTAARLGLDTSSAVDDHIRAAARYVSRMDTVWMRAVPDREQRMRFVLASYNAGPGHVIDAQRLAGQLGLDPARWDGNVERAVLLLAKPRYFNRPEMKNGYCKGSQVFHYVRGVLAVYSQLKGS